MAQVTIRINGYAHTVGCEDGQEAHLQAMAQQIESRVESIKRLGSQSGEARMLVLAALLMADELHDVHLELNALRAGELNAPRAGEDQGSPARARRDAATARRLSRLAKRAEEIAAGLEAT